jgi:hypothetical protein
MLHDHRSSICMVWDNCDSAARDEENFYHRCHFWTPEIQETRDSPPNIATRQSLLMLIVLSMWAKGFLPL